MAPKSDHKRKSSKHKIDRRLGVNLWGRPKSPVNLRSYAPGEHGQRRKKPTDYGVQLLAKQKLKGYYGNIGEKQFRKYYYEAVRRRGDTAQNLIGILESRLDLIICLPPRELIRARKPRRRFARRLLGWKVLFIRSISIADPRKRFLQPIARNHSSAAQGDTA